MVSPGCQLRDSCSVSCPDQAGARTDSVHGCSGVSATVIATPPPHGYPVATASRAAPSPIGATISPDANWWTWTPRGGGRGQVLLPGADRAHQVRRAAGAQLPLGPGAAIGAVGRPIRPALKRVVVGEPAPVERAAAEDRVVHRPLDPVGIALVAGREEQAPASITLAIAAQVSL